MFFEKELLNIVVFYSLWFINSNPIYFMLNTLKEFEILHDTFGQRAELFVTLMEIL